MRGLGDRLRAFGGATLDVGLSILGVSLVLIPTVGVLSELLEPPLPEPALEVGLLVVSVTLACPFATHRWSRGWLGTYVLGFWLGLVGLGVAGAAIVVAVGAGFSGSDLRPQLALVALAHVGAVIGVWHSGDRLRPRQSPPSGRSVR